MSAFCTLLAASPRDGSFEAFTRNGNVLCMDVGEGGLSVYPDSFFLLLCVYNVGLALPAMVFLKANIYFLYRIYAIISHVP